MHAQSCSVVFMPSHTRPVIHAQSYTPSHTCSVIQAQSYELSNIHLLLFSWFQWRLKDCSVLAQVISAPLIKQRLILQVCAQLLSVNNS